MTAKAPAGDIDLEWIVRNMVGDNSGDSIVDRLSLEVRAGEIVCIYGLMGAGRTELLETVAGRLKKSGGEIRLRGQEISGLSIERRLALAPKDRRRDGLV